MPDRMVDRPIPYAPALPTGPPGNGHAPGIKQFGEALVREDLLFFRKFAHTQNLGHLNLTLCGPVHTLYLLHLMALTTLEKSSDQRPTVEDCC